MMLIVEYLLPQIHREEECIIYISHRIFITHCDLSPPHSSAISITKSQTTFDNLGPSVRCEVPMSRLLFFEGFWHVSWESMQIGGTGVSEPKPIRASDHDFCQIIS
jgi:hypothetical protein